MKLKTIVTLGALIAGSAFAISAVALPVGGDDETLYFQYYTNPSKTVEAGVRVISNGANCQAQRIDYGLTTQYRTLVREVCTQL